MFLRLQNPNIFTGSVAHYSVKPDSEALSKTASDFISRDVMRTYSPKRRLDFVAGRYCALKALEKSGVKNCRGIGVRTNGAPDWPQGWTGSITHTDGFASAAVVRADSLHGLGIDSERVMTRETADEVAGLSLLPSEIQRWENQLQKALSFESYVTLIFSAKESVYKCLNPIIGRFLEFHDVEILTANIPTGKFCVNMIEKISEVPCEGRSLNGIFAIAQPYIHTAVEMAHNPNHCKAVSAAAR